MTFCKWKPWKSVKIDKHVFCVNFAQVFKFEYNNVTIYLLLLDIVISVLLTPGDPPNSVRVTSHLSTTVSVESVKTCYFCADYSHVCRKNDRAIEPMRMYCESFLLNRNEPLGKHFRQPSQVKYLAEDLFAVALEHKNVKTALYDLTLQIRLKLGHLEPDDGW
jgi:hypothetical protein